MLARSSETGYSIRPYETAWKLTHFHPEGLTTESCFWRPAHKGFTCTNSPMDAGMPIGRTTRR
jgi:hypothetical protein